LLLVPYTLWWLPTQVKSIIPEKSKKDITADIVFKFLIGSKNMAMIYNSPNPYYGAFGEVLDLSKFDIASHQTAGLYFFQKDDFLILASMKPGTPRAWVPWWQTCI
jgi:hypothetical protein